MNFRINWEALGIGASLACAIHCAVLPLFMSSLPLFGINIIHNIFVEVLLLGSAFVIGFTTLWHGYKKHHHKKTSLILFCAGMLLFAVNQFVSFPYSKLLFIVPAAALIIAAHFLNHRYCSAAKHCHKDDCNH
ncbi:MAG: MerC domain-containing protein [Chitinophagaceae bacterium]|nr:MerC domain-containing protein [Chitinophagaceae bacterium]